MATGIVKWFDAKKGYGFIQPADGSRDVFVHISAVQKAGHGDLPESTRIRYKLHEGRPGKISAEDLQIG